MCEFSLGRSTGETRERGCGRTGLLGQVRVDYQSQYKTRPSKMGV